MLSSSEEQAWYTDHVPLLDCPDDMLLSTYYNRWQNFKKHIKRTAAGFVITEFLPPVSWAGSGNTIACPAGHHFYEGRWIRDSAYLNDYARFWFQGEGEPRKYSFWAADSIYAFYKVHGDLKLVADLLPELVRNYGKWEADRLDLSGLFWQFDDRDGMEYSLGGSGLRPTINSYMYGDAQSIADMAEGLGNREIADTFRAKAMRLKSLVLSNLWDDREQFFKARVNAEGWAYTRGLSSEWVSRLDGGLLAEGELVNVCELQGYLPWYFNLPNDGYEKAWEKLMDPAYFRAPYGLTTAERRHPQFMMDFKHECLWNGPVWPFATSQTLTAMANLLRNYSQTIVTKDDYWLLLQQYARSHRRTEADGRDVFWVDENLDPFTGEWLARKRLYERNDPDKDRGADYNHSTFCDLIISGLCGIIPQAEPVCVVDPLLPDNLWDYFRLKNVPYRGHLITVSYDQTGEKYGEGRGFQLFVDGVRRARSERIGKLSASLHME